MAAKKKIETKEEPKKEVVEQTKEPKEKPKNEVVVAEGKSITSKKGILGAGSKVKPEYLAEGAYDSLLEKGILVKK